MADHYVALNQGIFGDRQTDFLTGTASTAGTNQIELRVADGTNLTKKDVILALEAYVRFFETSPGLSLRRQCEIVRSRGSAKWTAESRRHFRSAATGLKIARF